MQTVLKYHFIMCFFHFTNIIDKYTITLLFHNTPIKSILIYVYYYKKTILIQVKYQYFYDTKLIRKIMLKIYGHGHACFSYFGQQNTIFELSTYRNLALHQIRLFRFNLDFYYKLHYNGKFKSIYPTLIKKLYLHWK